MDGNKGMDQSGRRRWLEIGIRLLATLLFLLLILILSRCSLPGQLTVQPPAETSASEGANDTAVLNPLDPSSLAVHDVLEKEEARYQQRVRPRAR